MLQSTINRRNLNFIRLCTPDPWKLYLVFGGSDYHPPSSWVSFCGRWLVDLGKQKDPTPGKRKNEHFVVLLFC